MYNVFRLKHRQFLFFHTLCLPLVKDLQFYVKSAKSTHIQTLMHCISYYIPALYYPLQTTTKLCRLIKIDKWGEQEVLTCIDKEIYLISPIIFFSHTIFLIIFCYMSNEQRAALDSLLLMLPLEKKVITIETSFLVVLEYLVPSLKGSRSVQIITHEP